jgi:XTP/dITP diphosphohydrolase
MCRHDGNHTFPYAPPVPAPERLLIATGNAGKVREFRDMLNLPGVTLSGLADFPALAEVEETGRTFRSNAVLKASGYARATGLWSVADDSGLAVDALDGSPGVYSARWAAMHDAGSGNDANNRLLRTQMEHVPDHRRSARFVCVLAVADPDGRVILTVDGTVEGTILRQSAGVGGFGYDPLFYVGSLGRSLAEVPPAQKHAISHRGTAVRRLVPLLSKVWGVGTEEGPEEGRV